MTREDVAAYQRIVVDCQPLVHRWLSPHHKTGLVARSIGDEAGTIRDEYRRADRVRYDSVLARVADELPRRPERYAERPGYVPVAVIGAACEPRVLGATIAMLLSRGAVACCNMSPGEYAESRDWYARFLEGKKAGNG